MQLTLTPGNSLTCRVNHHKEGWNGVICSNAEHWNCLAEAEFRSTYCATGDPRCFHLHAFDAAAPSITIDGSGANWLLDKEPHALDDQLLFLWGFRATGARGIPEGTANQSEVLFGVYRVKEVEKRDLRHRAQWIVKPYSDGWAKFDHAHVARPRFERIGGNYLTELDARDVERVLDEVASSTTAWPDAADRKRFDSFRAGYPKWIKVAQRKAEVLVERFNQATRGRVASAAGVTGVRVTPGNKPLRDLEHLVAPVSRVAPSAAAGVGSGTGSGSGAAVAPREGEGDGGARFGAPAGMPGGVPGSAAAAVGLAGSALASAIESGQAAARSAASGAPVGAASATALAPLIEPGTRAWIAETYGADRALELEVATRTKDLVVLRGDPGVGKSHLALRLLVDPTRERTLVVPVSATWRGREDLLGYVNPIHGRFERTPFTEFLFDAAAAWERGDRRTRLVIFEEFNLSQPEHWLADVLAVSQYDAEADRRIVLAGASKDEAREVLLSPAVRFVATINSDHTTRPLSPRVLDRAAVVTLELTAKEALKRVALPLQEWSVHAIANLDFLLRPKGSPFSIRTARALQRALSIDASFDEGVVLDLVLLQQVLSKLRLMAHDAADAALLHALNAWAGDLDGRLPRCAAWIDGCKDALDAGRDVVQA
ncbi:MAG: hypothetical protein R3F49_19535 [Planctomycetota bacterium]